MAFVVSTLQNNIKAVFDSMKENATSKDFADGISNAIVTFVSTGSVATTDTGAVTGGTFAGSGTGSLTVTATNCSKIIEDACNSMKSMTNGGDDYLATEIGKGIKKMADDGVVVTSIIGTLTTPTGATTPMAGAGRGTISCDSTALVTALKNVFKEMWNNKATEGYDGNLELAKKLASEIDSFWKRGSISTSGQANLSGSSGSGSIS